MKNITKYDLNKILEFSKDYYINDAAKDLSDREFLAQGYVKAVINVLQIKDEFTFPEKINVEPVD